MYLTGWRLALWLIGAAVLGALTLVVMAALAVSGDREDKG